MTAVHELVVGQLYYLVQYPDRTRAHPIVTTYKYKGKTDNGRLHYFEIPGGMVDGNLFMEDSDLGTLVNREGLMEELHRGEHAS